MKILLTGKGYLASRWLQSPSNSAATIVQMQGRIPSVDLASALEGVDVVAHLAGVAPPKGEKDPVLYDTVNHLWTTQLGEECLKRKICLFFPSTSSVYDASDGRLLTEEDVATEITGPYARAQFAAENDLRALARQGLKCVIARFGSVFGAAPRTSFDRVVNKFVALASQGLPLTVQKDSLENLYPYTYVGDVAQAINFFIEQDIFNGETYNVVSQNEAMAKVVEAVQAVYPNTPVQFGEYGKKVSFGMDDSKLRSLGFSPTGNLADGVKELAATLSHE